MLWVFTQIMQKKVQYRKRGSLPLITRLLCFCLAFPYAVTAQTDTAKKLNQVNVKTKPLPKIQTITPSQQITANEFDQLSALNVADAIRDFAGVNIKDYGGIGGLKTVSVRSLGAGHLAVFYDGVQINDAENGEIDLGRLNLENIRQITLYNGQPPQICMPARAFASASVLSIIPIHPNLTAAKPYQLLLGIKGGSFGLVNPYLQWQQRLSSAWSIVVNGYFEKGNGQYKYRVTGDGSDTSSTRTNADISAAEADGALYYARSDSNKFDLHLNYYYSDRGLPGAVVFYNPISNQRLWNRDIFLQSGYERIWQNSLHLLINTKLSQDYTRYADPDFLNNAGGLDDQYNQREFYQSATLSFHLTQGWEISYAADAALTGLDASLFNFANPTRFTLLNVLASSFKWGKWQLQGNLLHTNVSEWVKTGNASPARSIYSPTLMATFQPFNSPNLQLRAFYKDIFRNPTFDEQYYFSVDGSRNIKPEFAKQYDAGFTYVKALNSFLDFITLTVDGYYNTVTDKIVALPNQNPAISSIINLGKVNITGVDAGLKTQTKLNNGWRGSLAVNYTYQDAVDVTNPASSFYRQQIPYTPKNTLALNGGVDYKQAGLYYNLVWSSSRYYLSNNDPENLVDGYAVSDVSFIYKFLADDKPAAVSVHIDNLFNDNYVIIRSFPMPGRSLLLSFQINI
jgi:outer membrane cobalamin receptor